ncbi:hypothetical protein [Acinetobacter towneri]|uniref:Uncharacterized protein n=1 Tax=Acinetobacter towneri TaxID=202956 RepID=A0AB35LYK4_9GAMM|nr:hypothetical protein [Acinetobacter towneri]MCO8055986.1 hypothetical protein [Acinetobacter towneri]MDM1718381.1 hypothetical protein [Acinetobacter towneri]MDM1730267.1 hypothetical protein [Acinetobacter towneri]MDM1732849.1 hypothetical protein [Acinetobacter towneri]MDM1736114.1 hypothetical protein [Acinetobacter towneri]
MNRETAPTIKEWKSYSEQLSILEQRGLVVTDYRDLPKLIMGTSFGSVIFRISNTRKQIGKYSADGLLY